MEIRIYNNDFNLLGIVENQTSLVWTRRFFEAGDFLLYLPLTQKNLNLFTLGNIVTYKGANEAGIIEDINLRSTSTERVIIVQGRFLPSYLDRRLVRPTLNFSGKVEVAMRKIITDAVAIPRLEMGTLNDFPETVDFQATYRNVLDTETKLSKGSNIGFKIVPDFTDKVMYFETFKGLNKSRSQTDRPFVEFSDRFDNLASVERRTNDQLLKNVGYVGGEGEGSERIFVTVGDDTLTGLERREVFVDAKDLRSDDLTENEYLAVLATRGNEKLKEMILSDSYDVVTIPTGNFIYKTDYDLGDIVTVSKKDWNMKSDMMITEIQEVYEHGNATIIPVLGSALPSKINWEE